MAWLPCCVLPQPPAGLFQGPQTLITGISLLSRLEQRENKGVTVRPVTESGTVVGT